jgi:hypothetical protein
MSPASCNAPVGNVSVLLDGVAMSLPQQTNDIVKLVNNHSKQTDDVTSQYAYIECFQCSDRSILPSAYDLASIFMSKT